MSTNGSDDGRPDAERQGPPEPYGPPDREDDGHAEDARDEDGADDRPEESQEVRDASPLARFFFLKTTFAILLVALLLVGGVFAYGMLTKESLPDLDIPRATITTTWPGADARSIEEQVTDNIEDELTSLSGVRSIESASYDSFSVISVEFEASVNSETAMAELRAAVSDAEAELPDAAEQPTVTQVTVDDRPILTLALTGTVDARTLSQLGRDVRDRLERVTGVDEVTLGGEREEIVQILLQPERMLALGVSSTAVRDAITSANVEQPFGEIRSAAIGAVVRLEGRFRDLDDLRALPVARQQQGNVAGRAVRLDEVAKVRRTIEREQTRAAYSSGGRRYVQALEVSITKSPGTDTVEVVDQVRQIIAEMRQSAAWPQGVQDRVVQDGAEDIWSSLGEVFVSGLQSMAIVFVILFITIAWREALITGLSIPITFAGVLLFLLLMGQTLNELVIIGMVIALVLIIDVFIIMMEGMHDEIYVQKATFGQAVLRTFKRYGKPAFAAQITTILALMPLMSIGGVAGTFIRILPLTTILCLVIAFALALFAAMPMARWLLKPPEESENEEAKESRADRVTRHAMDWLEGWNAKHVLPSRKRAKIWVFGAFGVFALSLVAFTQTRVELFPMTDAEQLGINIDLPPTTPLAETQKVADAVGEILRHKPYLKNTVMLTGRRSPFASGSVAGQLQPDEAENFIGFSSIFTDRGDREGVSYELAEDLRGELSSWLKTNVAGAVLQVVPQQSSPTPGDPVEIEIAGPDIDTLRRLSRQVQAALREGGGVTDVRDNIVLNPEIGVQPDREAADFFGIAHGDLAGQLRAAFSSDAIGDFGTGPAEDDIEIRLGTEWPSNPGEAGPPRNLSELATIRAFTAQGRPVALSQLIKPAMGEGPVAISHAAGERALTVLARNQGRTVTEIVGDLEPKLEEMKADWPEGYSYTVGGEAADTGETFGSAGVALIVAVMLMIGVLVIMFDSFAQALIIVATMPLAIIGAFIGFFVFGLSFSFYAMIGLVSLIGIVINTGIIMVDTMNQELAGGASVTEAAAAGSARRLRPVVTTSVTTIIGLIPLAISSDAYRPLTLVIIFGLISATILALFVVPALYLLLTKQGNAREPALD